MPTYFGYQTEGGTQHSIANRWDRNKGYVTGFTCPGTGKQTVKELSAWAKSAGGTPGHIRIAIYDAAHNLVCEGAAEVTVSSTTAGWVGHLTQADITPNPCELDGGTQYDIAVTRDSTDVLTFYTTGSAANYTRSSIDYTGGFPASLNDATDSALLFSVRCGVDSSTTTTTTTTTTTSSSSSSSSTTSSTISTTSSGSTTSSSSTTSSTASTTSSTSSTMTSSSSTSTTTTIPPGEECFTRVRARAFVTSVCSRIFGIFIPRRVFVTEVR